MLAMSAAYSAAASGASQTSGRNSCSGMPRAALISFAAPIETCPPFRRQLLTVE